MTDWPRLLHAYGPAVDTPGHLEALLGRDARSLAAAEDHLDIALLHQGFIYAATGPAADWIARRLLEDAFTNAPPTYDEPLTETLMRFLAGAAGSANSAPAHSPPRPDGAAVQALQRALEAGDPEVVWGDALLAARTWEAIDGMRAAAPSIHAAAAHHLTHERRGVRIEAYAALADAAVLADRAELVEQARAMLLDRVETSSGGELAALAIALSVLGDDLSAWLEHPDPQARLAAACRRPTDPAARRIMLEVLMDPPAFDSMAEDHMPDRFTVIGWLADSGAPPEELLPAALAQLPEHVSAFGYGWAPFLFAFHGTPQMKPYLAALVRRRDVWDRRNGNASAAFADAGLPHDRHRCAEIAGVEVPRRFLRFWRR